MKHPVYNMEGTKVSDVALPERVFGAPWNADLVHQVVVSMQANARTPVAHTKDRGDVRGGGRKPWRQKGTGRARHGSRRSPIWVGGGVTHGPRNDRVYTKKINKKMRTNALYSALSQKLRDGEIIFIDSMTFPEPKTKTAKSVLMSLAHVPEFAPLARKKKNAALIATPEFDSKAKRSFKNIGSVYVEDVHNINPVSVLSYKYVVFANPERAIEYLLQRGGLAREQSDAAANSGEAGTRQTRRAQPASDAAKRPAKKTGRAASKTAVKKKASATVSRMVKK